MTLSNLMQQIESEAFSARLSLAGTLPQLIELLRNEPAVVKLVATMRKPGAAFEVLKHANEIARTEYDNQYLNPRDIALASYAWGVARAQPTLSTFAAEAAFGATDTWWAKKMGLMLREEQKLASRAAGSFRFSEWQGLVAHQGRLLASANSAGTAVQSSRLAFDFSRFAFETEVQVNLHATGVSSGLRKALEDTQHGTPRAL
jgi:hypothetical protein